MSRPAGARPPPRSPQIERARRSCAAAIARDQQGRGREQRGPQHQRERHRSRLTQEQPLIAGEVAADRACRSPRRPSGRPAAREALSPARAGQRRARGPHPAARRADRHCCSDRAVAAGRAADRGQGRGGAAGPAAGHAGRSRCGAPRVAARPARRRSGRRPARPRTPHRITQAERTILTAESRLAELYATKEQLDRDLLGRQRPPRADPPRGRATGRPASRPSAPSWSRVEERAARPADGVAGGPHPARGPDHPRPRRAEHRPGRGATRATSTAEQDWAALEAEIEELKEKIQRLGNVNLDAIAEQDELEKRADVPGHAARRPADLAASSSRS